MGFFNKTPLEIEKHEAKKLEEAQKHKEAIRKAEEQRLADEFARTPAGQARSARNSGSRTFQISLPLLQTAVNKSILAFTPTTTNSSQHGAVIDSIEAEGWKLEHAGYVYQMLGSVTTKHLLETGLRETVSGDVLGIYIFRLDDK